LAARGVGCERPTLLDTDGGQLEAFMVGDEVGRFMLDQCGQVVEVLSGVVKHRDDLLARAIDERGLRPGVGGGQWIDPDLLHQGHRLIRLAVDLEPTQGHHNATGP
jgi:hypothetical protein